MILLEKNCTKSQVMVVVLEVHQSCPSLCNPMDCSLPDSTVHRLLQARILEWVAMPSTTGSSNPGIKPRSPALQVKGSGWLAQAALLPSRLSAWLLTTGPAGAGLGRLLALSPQ